MTNRFHLTLKNTLALLGATLFLASTLFHLAFAAGSTQWTSDLVVTTPNFPDTHTSPIVIETSDGMYMAIWIDTRDGSNNVYAQKFNTDGTIQWAVDGEDVTTLAGDQPTSGELHAVADNAGGAFISWVGLSGGSSGNDDIWVMRMYSNGTHDWMSTGNPGINVSIDNTASDDKPFLLSDGTGGVYVIWRS